MGVFKRLNISPVYLLGLEPAAQEAHIKRLLANDIKPEQIAQMIETSNITATQVVNIQNDLEKMGIKFTDFGQGYYSYEPQVDR